MEQNVTLSSVKRLMNSDIKVSSKVAINEYSESILVERQCHRELFLHLSRMIPNLLRYWLSECLWGHVSMPVQCFKIPFNVLHYSRARWLLNTSNHKNETVLCCCFGNSFGININEISLFFFWTNTKLGMQALNIIPVS